MKKGEIYFYKKEPELKIKLLEMFMDSSYFDLNTNFNFGNGIIKHNGIFWKCENLTPSLCCTFNAPLPLTIVSENNLPEMYIRNLFELYVKKNRNFNKKFSE
jgi:hypothetical protein